jgi:UDP-N-acetylmuramyl pentapeptide synthase
VGREAEDDWRIGAVNLTRAGTRFELSAAGISSLVFELPLLGEPAAWAGAFAVAIGRALGLGDAEIGRGLAGARPAGHRMVPLRHASRPLFVLDDCYNANPASARAAIAATIALAAPEDRVILVLGDMLELGEESVRAHRELGEDVARLAPRAHLIAVGPAAAATAQVAHSLGISADALADAPAALERVRQLIGDDRPSAVLIKASRGIALERVVAGLMAAPS